MGGDASDTIGHVAVVVPARNEARRLGATLVAIDRARVELTASTTTSICVVVDASEDASAVVAREHLDPERDVVVEVDCRCAGMARRTGSELVLVHSPQPPAGTWVASTDADTTVPAHWLTRQLELAHRGAVAVAGIVELRDDERIDPLLRQRFAVAYGAGIARTHRHVHGANLGFRGDTYIAAGGWQALETGEDHDLWRRLRAVGPSCASPDLVVATSGRQQGRAPCGFADDMAMLAQTR